MRHLPAMMIIVIAALSISAIAAGADDGVKATTAITLPVDSVTIYPDGLFSVKRTGTLDVTGGSHDFALDLPDSADMGSLLLKVTNASIERVVFDGMPTYTLNFSAGGREEFTLRYLMYYAGSWEPRYDLHVSEDSVQVSAMAVVSNRGGEDLKDVFLKLAAGLSPAVTYRKTLGAVRMDADYYAESEVAEVAAAPQAFAPAPAALPSPSGRAAETLYIFELPGRKDIEADKEIAFPLFEIEAPINRTYTWDAYANPEGPALEEIRANNTMGAPWPEGTALLYRDDEYVSTIALPFTQNGTNASIEVGPSPGIDVKKSLREYNRTEEIRPSGGDNRTVRERIERWTYSLAVENRLDRPADVEVDDSRPREAEITDISPQPSEMTATGMKWTLGLPPREKVTIVYTYRIATPEAQDGR